MKIENINVKQNFYSPKAALIPSFGKRLYPTSETTDTFKRSKSVDNEVNNSTKMPVQNKLGGLFEKYSVDPKEIEVKSTEPLDFNEKQKAVFIEKLLEAHELAKKNVESGNIVKLGFATNLCLSDGSWHLATNFNNTRNDISSICGERSAVIVAYNDFLKKGLKTNNSELSQDDFKIKYLMMSSAKEIGTDKNASLPCADCLSWFNTTKFFDDKTKIAFFSKDENNKLCLEFKTLKDLLPMRGRDMIDSLPNSSNLSFDVISISNDAKRIVDEKNIQVKDILKTVKKAKEAYGDNNFTDYSGQNIGVCIMSKGELFSAPKIDWSKRWFVEPAEFAIAKSMEKFKSPTMPDIITYWGNNETVCEGAVEKDGVVSLKTLGRIKAIDKAAEPLIVTINGNDEIDVRSINDFLPKSSTFKQTYLK